MVQEAEYQGFRPDRGSVGDNKLSDPPLGLRWIQVELRTGPRRVASFMEVSMKMPNLPVQLRKGWQAMIGAAQGVLAGFGLLALVLVRSEEHTSELQSLRHLV